MPLAKEKGVSILPVDSEHSAIFQSLQGNTHDSIEKILLTASGGPFRGKSREFLKHVKLEDALKQNPYDKTRGSKGAYIRYLRYTVDGWYSSDRTARYTGYEAADPVCAVLSGTKIHAGRSS